MTEKAPAGTKNPAQQNIVEVWKSGSISNTPSTVSSFRSGAAYQGVAGGTSTGAIGTDPALVELINNPDKAKEISKLLVASGYSKRVSSKYNKKLGDDYQKAITEWTSDADRTGREILFEEWLAENPKISGDKKRIATGTVTITSPAKAAALIEARFKAELGRTPTPEELDKYTKRLNKRESKPSAVSKATPKMVGGRLITTYEGGFERDRFINDIIRKTPEYKQKQEQANSLTIQELAKTAAANGLDLNKDFGSSIDGWMKQIASGTDIETIKSAIRQNARLGMPDRVAKLLDQGVDLESIYAPYRKAMATVLEVNPDTISLNDPTLRGAIGPDKEMTIYDFQRALRKDPRWQYTDNAREEVSNAALRVLQDFGFQR